MTLRPTSRITRSEIFKKPKYFFEVGNIYKIKISITFSIYFQNKQAVEEFFHYYDNGYYKHQHTFTIFNEEMRTEAKYLYELFYTAKDFDTFYKTAAWARYYLNKNLFAYTFYIAALQRPDTAGLVLPAFFEIWPQFFANMNVFKKMYAIKSKGLPYEQFPEYGVVEDGNQFVFYSNYSDYHSFGYGKDEYKISYFTEDIGWNTYYNFFHSVFPFWQKGDNIAFGLFKERRGEIYYYFYQQLLARYYLERLTNGLGQIPTFSWYQTFKSGYYPFMNYVNYPFVQRSDEYFMQTKKNLDDLRFVRNYEDTFLTWLEQGKFEAVSIIVLSPRCCCGICTILRYSRKLLFFCSTTNKSTSATRNLSTLSETSGKPTLISTRKSLTANTTAHTNKLPGAFWADQLGHTTSKFWFCAEDWFFRHF